MMSWHRRWILNQDGPESGRCTSTGREWRNPPGQRYLLPAATCDANRPAPPAPPVAHGRISRLHDDENIDRKASRTSSHLLPSNGARCRGWPRGPTFIYLSPHDNDNVIGMYLLWLLISTSRAVEMSLSLSLRLLASPRSPITS